MGVLRDLFGTGTWGTGGNLVASAALGALAYVLRGPLGRWLAKHIAPHVARHVAAHLASPAGFIEAPEKLTQEQYDDLVARWKAAHAASAGAPNVYAPGGPVVGERLYYVGDGVPPSTPKGKDGEQP